LLVDAIPLLAFLAIPVAEAIRRRRVLLVAFVVCQIWGIAVQVVGAMAYDVVGWNSRDLVEVDVEGSAPVFFTDANEARREAWARRGSIRETQVDVNSRRGYRRLWSIRDSQILYYLDHFGEARARKQAAVEQFLQTKG
jgi:hypothetical protein